MKGEASTHTSSNGDHSAQHDDSGNDGPTSEGPPWKESAKPVDVPRDHRGKKRRIIALLTEEQRERVRAKNRRAAANARARKRAVKAAGQAAEYDSSREVMAAALARRAQARQLNDALASKLHDLEGRLAALREDVKLVEVSAHVPAPAPIARPCLNAHAPAPPVPSPLAPGSADDAVWPCDVEQLLADTALQPFQPREYPLADIGGFLSHHFADNIAAVQLLRKHVMLSAEEAAAGVPAAAASTAYYAPTPVRRPAHLAPGGFGFGESSTFDRPAVAASSSQLPHAAGNPRGGSLDCARSARTSLDPPVNLAVDMELRDHGAMPMPVPMPAAVPAKLQTPSTVWKALCSCTKRVLSLLTPTAWPRPPPQAPRRASVDAVREPWRRCAPRASFHMPAQFAPSSMAPSLRVVESLDALNDRDWSDGLASDHDSVSELLESRRSTSSDAFAAWRPLADAAELTACSMPTAEPLMAHMMPIDEAHAVPAGKPPAAKHAAAIKPADASVMVYHALHALGAVSTEELSALKDPQAAARAVGRQWRGVASASPHVERSSAESDREALCFGDLAPWQALDALFENEQVLPPLRTAAPTVAHELAETHAELTLLRARRMALERQVLAAPEALLTALAVSCNPAAMPRKQAEHLAAQVYHGLDLSLAQVDQCSAVWRKYSGVRAQLDGHVRSAITALVDASAHLHAARGPVHPPALCGYHAALEALRQANLKQLLNLVKLRRLFVLRLLSPVQAARAQVLPLPYREDVCQLLLLACARRSAFA